MEHEIELLAASLIALACGPLICALARVSRRVSHVVHLAVVAGVGALVLLEVLPHCVECAGIGAVAALAVGLALPLVAEKRLHRVGTRAVLPLALAALALHALTDGLALAAASAGDAAAVAHAHVHDHGHAHVHEHAPGAGLAWAVILHKLPEGAAVWWLFAARSRALALGALLLVAVATAAGTILGVHVPAPDAPLLALAQAFLAGVLLHVLVHRHAPRAEHA